MVMRNAEGWVAMKSEETVGLANDVVPLPGFDPGDQLLELKSGLVSSLGRLHET
jgi:hypothetical protein